MKLRAYALGLLAGVLSGIAVAGGAGIARADPATDPGPAPGIINQLLTETPDLFVDPRDEGGPGAIPMLSECIAKINLSGAGNAAAGPS